MRTLLLLLGVTALAVATSFYEDGSQGYQSNTEYVYRYQSQAITGIPHRALENSGLVFRCNVRLQFRDSSTVTAKCEHVEVFRVVGPWRWHEQLPEDKLTPLDSGEMTTIRSEVEKPFGFRWENGKIPEVRVASQEPSWSINIKKGILNMLKINLTPNVSPQEPQLQELITKLKSAQYGSPYHSQQDSSYPYVYKVMEDGISGKCESIYGIANSQDSDVTMTVTKVRNYKKCASKPSWEEGMFTSLTTPGKGFDTRSVIKRFAHSDFSIKGSRQNFLIQGVRINSKYIVRPFTEYHGDIVTSIFQDLELIRVQPISSPLAPGSRSLQKPLQFEIPNYRLDKQLELDSNDYRQFRSYSSQDKVSQVDSMVSQVISYMAQQPIPDDVFNIVNQIRRMMTYMSQDELFSLVQKYLDANPSSDVFKKKQFILDMLAAVPTSDSLLVNVKLLTDPRVPANCTTFRIRQLAFKVIPDSKIMSFVTPGGSPVISNLMTNATLRDPILLSIGAMIHRIYHHMNNTGIPITNWDNYFNDLASKYQQLYQGTSTQPAKESLLKSIGNSGLPHFMPLLKTVIVDKSQSPMLRQLAIFANRRIPQKFTELVADYVLPVYLDMTEKPGLRIASFIHMMDRYPDNRTLQLIVHTHNNETDFVVGAMVFDYWKTISQAKHPGLKPLAQSIRSLLPMLRPFRVESWKYPTALHLESVMQYLDQSIGLDFIRVVSPENSLPSCLISKMNVYNMGKSVNALEIGLAGKGVKRLLSKLVGPLSTLLDDMKDKSFDQMTDFLFTPLRQRQPGDYEIEVQKLIEKLDIKDRDVFDKMNLRYYMKILDVEVASWNIDQDTILRTLKNSFPVHQSGYYGDSGNVIKTLRTINLGRSSQIVPTTMGLSMYVNHTLWTMWQVDGTYSATPCSWLDWFKAALGYEQFSAKIQTTNTMFSMASFAERKAGVNMIPISSGVSQRFTSTSSIPITASVTIDTTNNVKFSLHLEMPSQNTNLFHAKYSSKVFVKSMELLTPSQQPIVKDVMPLTMWENNKPVTTTFLLPLPSINSMLQWKWTIPNTKPHWVSVPNMWWGQCDFQLQLLGQQYRSSNPVIIDVVFTKTVPQVKQHTPLSYKSSFGRSQYEQPTEVKVEPELSVNPQMYKMMITIGSQDKSTTIVPYFATCTSQWKYQTGFKITTPSSTVYQTDFMFSAWELLKPKSIRSDSDTVMIINGIFDQIQFKLQATQTSQTVEFDSVKMNTLYDFFMNQFGITSSSQSKYSERATVLPPESMSYMVTLDYQLPPNSPNVTKWINFWTNYTTHMLYPSYKIDPPSSGSPPEGRVISIVSYVPRWDKAFAKIQTPWSLYSVETPFFLPTYQVPYWYSLSYMQPLNSSSYLSRDLFHHSKYQVYDYSDASHDTCEISKSDSRHLRVKTFDQRVVISKELPARCPVVLAKDCQGSNLYALTAMFNDQQQLQLNLVVKDHVLNIIPSSSSQWSLSTSSVTIQLDGQTVSVSEGQTQDLIASDGKRVGSVSISNNVVSINVQVGVVLTYDINSQHLRLKVPSMISTHQCGLCGNNNGLRSDDLEGPSGRIFRLDDEHVYNYMIPIQSCQKETIRQQWGIMDPQDECNLVERNHVPPQFEDRNGQSILCVSTSPIKQCPENCRVTRYASSKNVGMHCMPANNLNAFKVTQDARQRPLYEMEDKAVHKLEQVTEHAQCQKIY